MARYPIYTVAIGGTLPLYIEAMTGDAGMITPIAAKLKPVADENAEVPAASVAAVGEATIAVQATSPGLNVNGTPIGPGFEVTIGEALSASLAPGFYMMDMAYAVAGQNFTTTRVLIRAVNAVSLP